LYNKEKEPIKLEEKEEQSYKRNKTTNTLFFLNEK
jgi:hypothetical protein